MEWKVEEHVRRGKKSIFYVKRKAKYTTRVASLGMREIDITDWEYLLPNGHFHADIDWAKIFFSKDEAMKRAREARDYEVVEIKEHDVE